MNKASRIDQRVFAAFAAAMIAFLVASPAAATIILDQEYWVPFDPENFSFGKLSNGVDFGRAQTFTVGVDGILDSVQAQLTEPGVTSARIIATSGGVPIGGAAGSTVLASTTIFSNVGETYTFDFSSAALAVTVGDILAIELFDPIGVPFAWLGSQVGGYAGGSDYFFNSGDCPSCPIPNWTARLADRNFRTFVAVAVPEPGTLGLVGVGLLGLGLTRRKRDAQA